ncbi:MAG: hypothetical protein VW339_10360, partial [Quisquiliibacterium sp.]
MVSPRAFDIAQFLETHRDKPTLQLVICGRLDDGESPLADRLVAASRAAFEQPLARRANGGSELEYQVFDTDRRRYILADTASHEQDSRV